MCRPSQSRVGSNRSSRNVLGLSSVQSRAVGRTPDFVVADPGKVLLVAGVPAAQQPHPALEDEGPRAVARGERGLAGHLDPAVARRLLAPQARRDGEGPEHRHHRDEAPEDSYAAGSDTIDRVSRKSKVVIGTGPCRTVGRDRSDFNDFLGSARLQPSGLVPRGPGARLQQAVSPSRSAGASHSRSIYPDRVLDQENHG